MADLGTGTTAQCHTGRRVCRPALPVEPLCPKLSRAHCLQHPPLGFLSTSPRPRSIQWCPHHPIPFSVLMLGKGQMTNSLTLTCVSTLSPALQQSLTVVIITEVYSNPDFCVNFSNFCLLAINQFLWKCTWWGSTWLTRHKEDAV